MPRFLVRLPIVGIAMAMLWSASANAQQFVQFKTVDATERGIQILANDTMNFNTERGSFDAAGDAQVLFDEVVVFADFVEALFDAEGEGESRTVSEFSSRGDVYFASGGVEGQADRLDADLNSATYVFTGSDVQIVTNSGRILSDQIVVMDEAKGILNVKSSPGASFLIRDNDTIAADQIELWFDSSDEGSSLGTLKTLVAIGDVRGDFAGTQLNADRLQTDADGVDIDLRGNVVVRDGGTVLGGDCMIYNTETGDTALSRCPDGQATSTQRVRGRLTLTDD